MKGNNGYIEWVEEMGNKCPNCDSVDFDIIKRKCLDCDYELSHKTLSTILPVKKVIKENLEIIPEENFEDPYDSKSKGFYDDSKYFNK